MRAAFRAAMFCSILCGLCAADNVLACSVTGILTSAEITDFADVILLVKVPKAKITIESPIEMHVIEIVKGDFKAKTVTVYGQTARYDGPNNGTPPYDTVRPGGQSGNCFANDYKADGYFLLFLENGRVDWASLAATNEEVSGSQDPWVVWVKERLAWRNSTFCGPIHEAAKAGDLAKVKSLLVDHPERASIKDNYGIAPLHDAAGRGHKDVAEFLLANHAEINVKTNSGYTPLHLAARKGFKSLMELLLAKGANVNANTNKDETPLHLAAENGQKDVIEVLLAKGADTNVKNLGGMTALHIAALLGHKDVAELLLDKGAEVNIRDKVGNTPLHLANENPNKDIIELLRQHGGHE